MQRILAIARLTWKSAFRYRLFWIMAVLLLGAVAGLPMLLKDDGTAAGLTQILLTYTLSSVTGLLGFFTLWLACGALARDIEDCQMQMVVVKPIARWQVWLGKWLGILVLDAGLLAISGAAIYGGLMWRAARLPSNQREILRNEVLVARGSARPAVANLDDAIRHAVESKFKGIHAQLAASDKEEIVRQVAMAVVATNEAVIPGIVKEWQIDLGRSGAALRGTPMQLRIKFYTANANKEATYDTYWEIGASESQLASRPFLKVLPGESYQEFNIPSDSIPDNGVLTVQLLNANQWPLQFPRDDGLEVLFRENGFGVNFCRGIVVILCWLGLLAAIGLAFASYLSFPVAAFTSLGVLVMGLSSGTLKSVVENGTVVGWDAQASAYGHSVIDIVMVPMFSAVLKLINLVTAFSPVDYLSSGRSITWLDLGLAVTQIILLLGGIFAAIGMICLTRRELASAQSQS